MRERRYKYTVWGGSLRQAQGPGFCTVSELVELAVKLRDREIFAVRLHCPEGAKWIAQGNALGKWPNKTPSPERAKGVVK